MSDRTYLFVHGLDGSGPTHWQHWLREKLETAGETVRFPDLPDSSGPNLDTWLAVLDDELKRMSGREIVVLAHSLGSMLWLHHASRSNAPAAVADRVLLVAPTSPFFWDPRAEGLLPMSIDDAKLTKVARSTRIVSSDNDDYCPVDDLREMAKKLDIPCDVVPGGGHLNGDAGFGPWPAIEAWALGGETSLV